MALHVWGLFTHPDQEWRSIREEKSSVIKTYMANVVVLAAIPAICTYFGTTVTGWSLAGSQEVVRLTPDSAASMALLAYLAMLSGVYVMGRAIHWMAQTYDCFPTISQCVTFASYTTTPLFLAGLIGLYPSLWLMMLVGLMAASWSTYLLYSGLPVFMNISKEQGFVFSSSILCIALVVLVAILAITVVLWSIGVGPIYTS